MARSADLELGHGVRVTFTAWGPHDPAGLMEFHLCQGGNCRDLEGRPAQCGGGILFDLEGVAQAFPNRELWKLESLDPLTVSPSLECGCQGCTHHGFIREGRWVPA